MSLDLSQATRPGALVVRANALQLPLEDESVDLIVTSPPYFAMRSYRDGDEHYDGQIGSEPEPKDFLEALWAATNEMKRVLKPSGSIFVNLGDKYAGSGGHNNSNIGAKAARGPKKYIQASGGVRAKSLMAMPWRYAIGCIDQLDLILRAEIIWDKPNGMPEPVIDRVRRSHEQFFHFTKQGKYFAALDQLREPHATEGGLTYAERLAGRFRDTATGNIKNGVRPGVSPKLAPTEAGRPPGSVWEIHGEPLRVPNQFVQHFAAFPSAWPVRLIAGWCPREGVVLDPFGGSGTTAMVAQAMGRLGISVDLSLDYCRLAQWRIFESDGGAQAVLKAQERGLINRQSTVRRNAPEGHLSFLDGT